MEQVDSDWRLRERLMAQAIASGGGSLDVRTWRRRIDAVFGDSRHFVPYAEAGGWAQDIFDVLAALDDLVSAGHAAAVVALAEHAHRRSDKAVQYIDDSDGWLTDISGRISELRIRACAEALPDPVELAGRLAELELTSELDTVHRAAATYVDVLGPDGIAAYRRIVEPKWRAAKKNKDASGHGAFAVTQAMIGVALAGGDPDELMAIRGGDLRTPDDYLEIARTLVAAGRKAESLDWSRRGLDAFVDRHWQTPPLREFLATQLRAADDNPAAEALWWEAFERHPSLEGYRKLLAESGDIDARRRQAIDLLRQRLDAGDTQARTRNPLLERAPATTLVEILLYEGGADDAWSAATSHGCDQRTWMTLARARETTHPLDAIPIYERAVAAQIDTKNDGGYRAQPSTSSHESEPWPPKAISLSCSASSWRRSWPSTAVSGTSCPHRQEALVLTSMIDLPTEVIGFHGTNHAAVPHLLAGDIGQRDEHFEWLGSGFYLWQDSPWRAQEFAVRVSLDGCLDLLNPHWHQALNEADDQYVQRLPDPRTVAGEEPAQWESGPGLRRHQLVLRAGRRGGPPGFGRYGRSSRKANRSSRPPPSGRGRTCRSQCETRPLFLRWRNSDGEAR